MTLEELALYEHIVSVFSILTFKLAVLVVGYLLSKLGYQLLVQGISGRFKFKGDFQGIKADLVSASPGTLFIVLAVILLVTAVWVDKPISNEVSHSENNAEKTEKPELPPPPKVKENQ